jgi:hypothetical protein
VHVLQVPLYVLYLDCTDPAKPKLIGAGMVPIAVATDGSKAGKRSKVHMHDALGSPVAKADISVALAPCPDHASRCVVSQDLGTQLHAAGGILQDSAASGLAVKPPQQEREAADQPHAIAVASAAGQFQAKLPTHDLHYHYHISGASALPVLPPHSTPQPPLQWATPAAPAQSAAVQQNPLATPPEQDAQDRSRVEPAAQAAPAHAPHDTPHTQATSASRHKSAELPHAGLQTQSVGCESCPQMPQSVQVATQDALQQAVHVQAAIHALQASTGKPPQPRRSAKAAKDKRPAMQRKRGAVKRADHNEGAPYGMNAFMVFAWEMIGFVSMRAAMNNALALVPAPGPSTADASTKIPTAALHPATELVANKQPQVAKAGRSNNRQCGAPGNAASSSDAKVHKRHESGTSRKQGSDKIAAHHGTSNIGMSKATAREIGSTPAAPQAAPLRLGVPAAVAANRVDSWLAETPASREQDAASHGAASKLRSSARDTKPTVANEPLIVLDDATETESIVDVAQLRSASEQHLIDAEPSTSPCALSAPRRFAAVDTWQQGNSASAEPLQMATPAEPAPFMSDDMVAVIAEAPEAQADHIHADVKVVNRGITWADKEATEVSDAMVPHECAALQSCRHRAALQGALPPVIMLPK